MNWQRIPLYLHLLYVLFFRMMFTKEFKVPSSLCINHSNSISIAEGFYCTYSTRVPVPSQKWLPNPPLPPQASVVPPGIQFGRLEKKPGSLYTLWLQIYLKTHQSELRVRPITVAWWRCKIMINRKKPTTRKLNTLGQYFHHSFDSSRIFKIRMFLFFFCVRLKQFNTVSEEIGY
jgi:hypothetical protein